MDLVVSVDELKSHLRLEGIETDDTLLCRYIKAAEGYCKYRIKLNISLPAI